MILGFRSKVLVILIRCVLKISGNLLSPETIQSFSEITILLEKLALSEKYSLIIVHLVFIVEYKFWVYL